MLVIDKTECIECGTCFHLCPFDAIEEKHYGGKEIYEVIEESCMECLLCLKACPLRAINWKEDDFERCDGVDKVC
ncbi:4Fe-4S binding protein [Thermovorax subterraneus]|nr:4Fe-4S binding protein [Thermovorax subterraneus]